MGATDEPVGRLLDGRPDGCPVYRWPGDEDFDRPEWPEAAGQRARWQSVIDAHALSSDAPGRSGGHPDRYASEHNHP